MPIQIVGKSGNPVESINDRLLTDSISNSIFQIRSRNGDAYSFCTQVFNVASGTPFACWYLRNDDPNKELHIVDLHVSWNGGDATHNSVMYY